MQPAIYVERNHQFSISAFPFSLQWIETLIQWGLMTSPNMQISVNSKIRENLKFSIANSHMILISITTSDYNSFRWKLLFVAEWLINLGRACIRKLIGSELSCCTLEVSWPYFRRSLKWDDFMRYMRNFLKEIVRLSNDIERFSLDS